MAWIIAVIMVIALSLYTIHRHLYSDVYTYDMRVMCSKGFTDGFLVYITSPRLLEIGLTCHGAGEASINVSMVGGINASLLLSCNNTSILRINEPELTMVYVRVEECKGVDAWVEARVLPERLWVCGRGIVVDGC